MPLGDFPAERHVQIDLGSGRGRLEGDGQRIRVARYKHVVALRTVVEFELIGSRKRYLDRFARGHWLAFGKDRPKALRSVRHDGLDQLGTGYGTDPSGEMPIGCRNGRHRHLRSFLVVTVFGLRRDLECGIPIPSAERTPGYEVLPDEIQSQGSPRRRHIDRVGALPSVAPPLEAVPESAAHGNRLGGIDADAVLMVRGVDRVRQVPGPAVDLDPRLVDVSVDHEERTGLETGFVGRPAA